MAHHAAISLICTSLSELQPKNAQPPMLVTPSGIFMLESELQPSNASLPMLVTLSGITMLVSDSQ